MSLFIFNLLALKVCVIALVVAWCSSFGATALINEYERRFSFETSVLTDFFFFYCWHVFLIVFFVLVLFSYFEIHLLSELVPQSHCFKK